MKETIHSNCPRCNGSGKVDLEGPLRECAAIVQKHGPLSAMDIHKLTKKVKGDVLDITAIHKRLERLIGRGVVKVEGARYRMVG